MKAAVIDAFGPSSALEVREIQKPAIKAGQILIKVHAAGVNPIDWKIREGWMKERFGEEFPMILGFDASGIIAQVGAGVADLAVGDEVFARSINGAGTCYAEFALLDPGTVAPKPASMSHVEAAAMPLAALTALNGLRDVGQVQTGDRVLIVGASGGVGVYAVQIAKNMGAHVTAVCSSRNVDLVSELGADQVIDYTAQNPLATHLPYDLIYDAVGTLKYTEAREVLSDQGVYMTLVPVEGIEFFIPGQTQRAAKCGYFLVWSPTAADLNFLGDWVTQGSLRSIIDSEFPLAQIRDAHERSQTERARGKIVLRITE